MKLNILLILLTCILLFGCNSNKQTNILNPVDSLGWQESEEYYFQLASVIKNHNNTLYIGNGGSGEILVFDADNNEFRFKFGKSGKGPGEFTNITDIEVFDDQIFAADFRGSRISVFSLEGEYIRQLKSEMVFFLEASYETVYGSRFPVAPGSKLFTIDGDSVQIVFDAHQWAADTYGLKYEDKDVLNRWYNFNTIDNDLLIVMRFAPYLALINKSGEILEQDYETPPIKYEAEMIVYGKPQQFKDGFILPVSYFMNENGELSYLYYYKNKRIVKEWYLDMRKQRAMLFYNWDLTGNVAWIPMLEGDRIYKFVIE